MSLPHWSTWEVGVTEADRRAERERDERWAQEGWEPKVLPGPVLREEVTKATLLKWFRLIEEGGDLCLEGCADEPVDVPEWLEPEYDSSGRRWEYFMMMRRRSLDAAAHRDAWRTHQQKIRTECMSIEVRSYQLPSVYRTWAPRYGTRLELVSSFFSEDDTSRWRRSLLADGKSDDRDINEAYANLVKNAEKALPSVTEEVLAELMEKRYHRY